MWLLENLKLHMRFTFVACIILPSDNDDLERSFCEQVFLEYLLHTGVSLGDGTRMVNKIDKAPDLRELIS